MDDLLIRQLTELAQACKRKEIRPIICGGLGVYLSFCGKEDDIKNMLRATQDIDLMFSKEDLLEEAKRRAMAEVIREELEYIVQEGKEFHGFKKEPDQELDILVPPMEELKQKNYRLRIVKSALHGHITEEAEYIDEDLHKVSLSDVFEGISSEDAFVYVPCPTNLMIMKLYAFNDRVEGNRENSDRAMAHAFDVFLVIRLTDRDDLKQGHQFISRHNESLILEKAKAIVKASFYDVQDRGWQTVLSSSNFFPDKNIPDRESELEKASSRLKRWFMVER